MEHATVNVTSGTPESPVVTAFVLSPSNLAQVLKEIILVEPKIIAMYNEFEPFAAELPSPWNALANPLVKEAVAALPTLLPALQNIQAILDRIGQVVPPSSQEDPPTV